MRAGFKDFGMGDMINGLDHHWCRRRYYLGYHLSRSQYRAPHGTQQRYDRLRSDRRVAGVALALGGVPLRMTK